MNFLINHRPHYPPSSTFAVKENFYSPYDSDLNSVTDYEVRRLDDTRLTDVPLGTILFDNPIFTQPMSVYHPLSLYPDLYSGIDDNPPLPGSHNYPLRNIQSTYLWGMPGQPDFVPPNWPHPWPGDGDPSLNPGARNLALGTTPLYPPPTVGDPAHKHRLRIDFAGPSSHQYIMPHFARSLPIAGIPSITPLINMTGSLNYGLDYRSF